MEHSAAALSRESFVNPCYHSTCDTVEKLSASMLGAVTRTNLAVAMDLSGADPASAAAARVEVVDPLELRAELELLGGLRSCVCNETGLAYSCGCADHGWTRGGGGSGVTRGSNARGTLAFARWVEANTGKAVLLFFVVCGVLAGTCHPKRWWRKLKARGGLRAALDNRWFRGDGGGGWRPRARSSRPQRYSRVSQVDDSRP